MAAFVSRYARAFADVVAERKLDPATIDAELSDFEATWKGSAELRELFANPAVEAVQKVALLDKMNGRMALAKEVRNLFAVLIEHGRMAQVAEVIAAYRVEAQSRQGIRPVEVVTARALDDASRAKLAAGAEALAGGKIVASFREDAAILGGAVIRIGSTVYDGSLRGRLERLKEALIAG